MLASQAPQKAQSRCISCSTGQNIAKFEKFGGENDQESKQVEREICLSPKFVARALQKIGIYIPWFLSHQLCMMYLHDHLEFDQHIAQAEQGLHSPWKSSKRAAHCRRHVARKFSNRCGSRQDLHLAVRTRRCQPLLNNVSEFMLRAGHRPFGTVCADQTFDEAKERRA